MSKIEPIKENECIGFTYTVTEEQVRRHQSLSVEEVFQWIEEMAEIMYELQTEEERERKYIFKPNKRPIHFTEEEQKEFWEFAKSVGAPI